MAKRFNPPPNWPPPPSPKWRPGPDWRPDPSWGPPPPGWQLWTEVNPFARGFPIALATVAAITVAAYVRFDGTEVAAAYCAAGVMLAAPATGLLGKICSFRWEWWYYVITAVITTPVAGEWLLIRRGY